MFENHCVVFIAYKANLQMTAWPAARGLETRGLECGIYRKLEQC